MKRYVSAALLLALSGCAHHDESVNRVSGLSNTSQPESAQQAMILRREAASLRDMAERRQREAQILGSDPSVDQEAVLQKRQLAQRLLEAANEAEREAEALRRQVPHGMVQ
jgi:hypothetical protein